MNDRTTPRVSVIMGAYNCASTLDEALESIRLQSFDDWEMVICDDGSSDATWDLLASWRDRYPGQITILRNDRNRQLSFTLNRCLAAASGDLIARMDADDRALPERLEKQVAYLDAHPETDLVGTRMRRFSEDGLADVVDVPENPDRWSLKNGVPFCHATILARREVFERVGNYTVSARAVRNEDLDLWFRFFDASLRGVNIPEPLYLVREDVAAMRRRTIKGRFNVFLTQVNGYRLLGYPRRWYVWPALSLTKALVPIRLAAAYRRLQKWRGLREETV